MQTEDQKLNEAAAAAAGGENQADEAAKTEATAAEEKAAQSEQTGEDSKAAAERDPQTEIAILRGQLEQLGKKALEEHERMLRAVAEAENVRRRAEADIERERKYAMERFVKGIIPVFDSLDQALTLSDRNDPATRATLDGVESTVNLMLKELSAFGVECINPQGEKFDPNLHQALSAVPSKDIAPNHILAVMQKGFILNGRVVRPAMVMVAKAAD